MSRTRVVLIGRYGQVATALAAKLQHCSDIDLISLARPAFDLSRPAELAQIIRAQDPDVVINAAAYTAVDRAEDEPELAHTVNAVAVGEIARGARSVGAILIHLSTDYVFDGLGSKAWTPEDRPDPQNVYGATKLAGERLALEHDDRTIIVRTAWVYSPYGHNFVKTMLRLARERDEISVVADQFGNPTSATDIAQALMSVLTALRDANQEMFGTYHYAGAGHTSWAGFAEEIFTQARRYGLPQAKVRAIPTSAFPTRAARPNNSRLDSGKFTRTFAHEPGAWPVALSQVLREISLARSDGS